VNVRARLALRLGRRPRTQPNHPDPRVSRRRRRPGWRTTGSAVAAVGVIIASVAVGGHLKANSASAADQAAGQLIQGLTIYSSPDGTGRNLGVASGTTTPRCQITGTTGATQRGKPVVGVTDPGITGPGFVILPPSSGNVTGLPDCASVPGFNVSTTVNTNQQTIGNCPKYDYQCEQQQADQSCQLTAEQQQALAQQAMADLELRYQQLFYKALAEQAAGKVGNVLLQQWLSGHTKATPADIADLIKQGALTPLDAALAATDALHALDEETDRYAGTDCTDGPDNQPKSNAGQIAQSNSIPNPNKGSGNASHTLQEVNPDAVDTSVDMSLIEPQDYVIRNDDKLLYREDDRPPDEIYADGFQPKDVSPNGQYNLNDKVSDNKPGPYVSTTYDRRWVVSNSEGRKGYLYVVDAQGGIDMEASPSIKANDGEQEVVFPGGIKKENIVGAYVYNSDGSPYIENGSTVQQFIPNKNYQGTRQPS